MESQATCAQCQMTLAEGQDQVATEDGTFCRTCFETLTQQVKEAVANQGTGINYPGAVLGGIVGGILGAVVWWGFTVVTEIAFGLVAIVIGFAVGKGIVMLSGGKRHLNLQIMSVVISAMAFGFAAYLVNRTFLLRGAAEVGMEYDIPLIPDPTTFLDVVRLDFGIMDLVFLGIVLFQAWSIPAPVKLES